MQEAPPLALEVKFDLPPQVPEIEVDLPTGFTVAKSLVSTKTGARIFKDVHVATVRAGPSKRKRPYRKKRVRYTTRRAPRRVRRRPYRRTARRTRARYY